MGLGHRGGSSAPLGTPLVIAIGIGMHINLYLQITAQVL